jgi:opacity protein-like surface antigen
MFTPNVGVEGTYYNQGKAKQTATDPSLGNVSATWKGDGLGIFAVGVLPFDPFSVFGKLGAVYSKVKVDATSSVLGAASASEHHTGLGWGVGAGYEFTRNLGARLEFERVRLKFQGEKADADLVTLGLHYRF